MKKLKYQNSKMVQGFVWVKIKSGKKTGQIKLDFTKLPDGLSPRKKIGGFADNKVMVSASIKNVQLPAHQNYEASKLCLVNVQRITKNTITLLVWRDCKEDFDVEFLVNYYCQGPSKI